MGCAGRRCSAGPIRRWRRAPAPTRRRRRDWPRRRRGAAAGADAVPVGDAGRAGAAPRQPGPGQPGGAGQPLPGLLPRLPRAAVRVRLADHPRQRAGPQPRSDRARVAATAGPGSPGGWRPSPPGTPSPPSSTRRAAGWPSTPARRCRRRPGLLERLRAEAPPPWRDSVYDAFVFHAALAAPAGPRPARLLPRPRATPTSGPTPAGTTATSTPSAARIAGWASCGRRCRPARAGRGRTSLLVTTDHGRGDGPDGWGRHGAEIPGADERLGGGDRARASRRWASAATTRRSPWPRSPPPWPPWPARTSRRPTPGPPRRCRWLRADGQGFSGGQKSRG